MHMADALISPAVGGVMWGAAAGGVAWCSRVAGRRLDDRRIPLMGVLGAFVFAAQMVNFAIPGTGSSGHLGGGLLLAVLLGPHAAFLTISSVLVIQALIFADGGLLALGCNIINLGFFPAFIAYPLVYRPLVGDAASGRRITAASIAAAVVGLQLGAFAVVLETVASGVAALPFATFALLMQPVHLAIGLVEGVVTAALLTFLHSARPELFTGKALPSGVGRRVLAGMLMAALFAAAGLSWFASSKPDGLEWSIARATGNSPPPAVEGVHATLARIQGKLAFLHGYSVPAGNEEKADRAGTSQAGVVGGGITLAVVLVAGRLLCRKRKGSGKRYGTV